MSTANKHKIESESDGRKDYLEFFGFWTKKDAEEFNTFTSDLDRVDPEDWKRENLSDRMT